MSNSSKKRKLVPLVTKEENRNESKCKKICSASELLHKTRSDFTYNTVYTRYGIYIVIYSNTYIDYKR